MDSFNEFPSLNFLHTFGSAGRNLSFKNAAKNLFVTQAAVSHQIKALEDYLGVKLFHREKRKVFLSEEGQKLLPSVVSGLQGIADSLENIRNYDAEDTIVVGVGSSFSANWLVQRLGAFYQRYPEVNLHMKISNNDLDFVADGTDLAVVWGKAPQIMKRAPEYKNLPRQFKQLANLAKNTFGKLQYKTKHNFFKNKVDIIQITVQK